jgi:TRAP-type uncharacterized transport system substrate-binding protein
MLSGFRRLWLSGLIVAASMLSSGAMIGQASAQDEALPRTAAEWKQQTNGGTIRIITKGLGCTCSNIASDMAHVLNEFGKMRILPVLGTGNMQGIADVLYLRGIDLSIVQSDILAYIRRNNIHPDIDNRIRYITKLYNSEVHIITRKETKTIQDLQGKVISLDVAQRGTNVTAENIFGAYGITFEPVYIERDVSIEMVSKGEIDAVIVVTGKPATSIRSVKYDNLHLLPIEFTPELAESYLPSEFTSEEYPNLVAEGARLSTIAVGEVMAVYNWPSDTERYRNLALFVDVFFDNFQQFLEPIRHEKWHEVNLAATTPGWTRFKPAEDKLRQILAARERPVESPDRQAQFAEFVRTVAGRNMTERETRELFEQFSQWLQNRQ